MTSSQSVALIRLGLSSKRRQLADSANSRMQSEVDELIETTKQVSGTIIEISNNLRPPIIEKLGPVLALRQEAKRFEQAKRCAVELDLQEVWQCASVAGGFSVFGTMDVGSKPRKSVSRTAV